ncbi:hypothetical protein K2F43_12610 [Clostridium estertheticum]|uniref:hypothetical protein n=1 Tax=Clostridium estertheticum TaxID=238834 RepID=UPI001C6DE5AC|nr:hypothetical protein [Clostridium estertheticum]MBW9172047.1 hypothetical protein [Clostridium estertheticum]WBL45590.1 hypothetical protein LOR37_12870 [Clostridium estertheticum]
MGGGSDDFTVEVKLYSIDANFTHWKAEYRIESGSEGAENENRVLCERSYCDFPIRLFQ